MKAVFRLWSLIPQTRKINSDELRESVFLPWRDTELDVSFGHSQSNEAGLKIHFANASTRGLRAICMASEKHANFPGAVHGGLVACALDEVMGQNVFISSGSLAISIESIVIWLASSPVNSQLQIKSTIVFNIWRFYFVDGYIELPNGRISARSRGLYFQPTAKQMAKVLKTANFSEGVAKWFK